MEYKNTRTELDGLIRSSMEITDAPSQELNDSLVQSLYRQEAAFKRQAPMNAIPLWYVPMLLNLVTFGMLAVLSLIVISNPYLSKFAAGICLYAALAGILITLIGVKRTNMKEDITVRIQKRGAAA